MAECVYQSERPDVLTSALFFWCVGCVCRSAQPLLPLVRLQELKLRVFSDDDDTAYLAVSGPAQVWLRSALGLPALESGRGSILVKASMSDLIQSLKGWFRGCWI